MITNLYRTFQIGKPFVFLYYVLCNSTTVRIFVQCTALQKWWVKCLRKKRGIKIIHNRVFIQLTTLPPALDFFLRWQDHSLLNTLNLIKRRTITTGEILRSGKVWLKLLFFSAWWRRCQNYYSPQLTLMSRTTTSSWSGILEPSPSSGVSRTRMKRSNVYKVNNSSSNF